MKKSFTLGQSNEILKDGKIYDLHNCYDVANILRLSDGTFMMRFDPNSEWGQECKSVVLKFTGVDYIEFRFNPSNKQSVDMQEIGYKSHDDMDDSWLLTEGQSTPQDHLFFRLGGSNYIRIHSKEAVLIEENEDMVNMKNGAPIK